jgi:hypothetical protein
VHSVCKNQGLGISSVGNGHFEEDDRGYTTSRVSVHDVLRGRLQSKYILSGRDNFGCVSGRLLRVMTSRAVLRVTPLLCNTSFQDLVILLLYVYKACREWL